MPVGPAAAGREGRDPAQVGEGGLAAQPVGVVPGGDQQLPGDLGADPHQRDQAGRGRGHERAEFAVGLGDLGVERLDAGGQPAQRGLDRVRRAR